MDDACCIITLLNSTIVLSMFIQIYPIFNKNHKSPLFRATAPLFPSLSGHCFCFSRCFFLFCSLTVCLIAQARHAYLFGHHQGRGLAISHGVYDNPLALCWQSCEEPCAGLDALALLKWTRKQLIVFDSLLVWGPQNGRAYNICRLGEGTRYIPTSSPSPSAPSAPSPSACSARRPHLLKSAAFPSLYWCSAAAAFSLSLPLPLSLLCRLMSLRGSHLCQWPCLGGSSTPPRKEPAPLCLPGGEV